MSLSAPLSSLGTKAQTNLLLLPRYNQFFVYCLRLFGCCPFFPARIRLTARTGSYYGLGKSPREVCCNWRTSLALESCHKAAEAQRIDGWILTMKRSGENDDGGGMHQNDEGASKRIKPGQRDDDEDKPEGCSEVLHLNVGGDLTAVLRRTLTSVEGSMLASRFSGRWDDSLERDRDGNFFIDQVRENPSDLKG